MSNDVIKEDKLNYLKDRRFPQTQEMKANIHTWLAWQEEPGKPMGQAITKRYLDAAASHAQQLIDWLCSLFDIEQVQGNT